MPRLCTVEKVVDKEEGKWLFPSWNVLSTSFHLIQPKVMGIVVITGNLEGQGDEMGW